MTSFLRRCLGSGVVVDTTGMDMSQVTDLTDFFRQNPTDYSIVGIEDWDISSVTTASALFMDASADALSTAQYDALLENWEAQDVNDSITIGFGVATYTASSDAADARQRLVDDHSWVITDGGTA